MKYAKSYDRETALNAAQSIFWDKGYHATSIKDLEEAMKMRSGSIYAAFKSKDALYSLSLEHYYERVQAALRHEVLEAPSPLTGLVQMIRRIGEAGVDDPFRKPCMLAMAVMSETTQTTQNAELARRYRGKMGQSLVEGFQKAQDMGEIPSDLAAAEIADQFQTEVLRLHFDAQMNYELERFEARVARSVQKFESLRSKQRAL